MSRYFDWSLMVGAFGLVGPPLAFLHSNVAVGPMFVSAGIFCVWFAMLVWGWYDRGARALLILFPSLLLILVWPVILGWLLAVCYYYPCS